MALNPNCEGDRCHVRSGQVRKMRMGRVGRANGILCRACWAHELQFRRDRNRNLEAFAQYDLPSWRSGEVYT